jgi:CBS domain-containing protein
MELMTARRIRHLPVLEQGTLVGMISIGDCVRAVIEAQQHEIDALKRYIAS